jgi:hypothetical protein
MDKNLRKIIGEDKTLQRGPNRYTRVLEEDDKIVVERGGAPSTVIADLVHKGLAYEALASGADDPAIRNLLRVFDQMIQHRIAPVVDCLQSAQQSLDQTRLFIATLFLTVTVKFEFPLESCSQEDLDDLHELLTTPANDRLTLITNPPATLSSTAPHPAKQISTLEGKHA